MAYARGSSVKILQSSGKFSGASTIPFANCMKNGERIVRGRCTSVNRSIARRLCIAAENFAKLFWREILCEVFFLQRATTGFGTCERGILRFGVLVVPL
jgi:hypothetical protein